MAPETLSEDEKASTEVVDAEEPKNQLQSLGSFIREQRKQAEYSLRDLADRANVSNPYLSQIERGLHAPSVRVLKAIAAALNVSAESLLVQAGLLESNEADGATMGVEDAVRADARLSADQKAALLAVYRSYLAQNHAVVPTDPAPAT